MSSKNASDYRRILGRFFSFCGVSPSEAVEFQKENPISYRFVDLAYEFLNTGSLAVSTKRTRNGAIRGFFLCNRAPLPQDSYLFKSDVTLTMGNMQLDEFRQILFASSLEYRCAFLMMFQSGSGCGELVYINENLADHVFSEVKKGRSVISLAMHGRKRSRNVRPYVTFIGGDSVECLRQLFYSRGWRKDDVLFRTKRGNLVNAKTLSRYFLGVAIKLGFIKSKTPFCSVSDCGGETLITRPQKNGVRQYGYLCVKCGTFAPSCKIDLDLRKMAGIRYRIHAHEIRDLFRTEYHRAQTYTQCDPALSEHMMGHSIDPLQYDKIIRDRDYALSEYKKALPFLNILSEDPRKISRGDFEEQKALDQAKHDAEAKRMFCVWVCADPQTPVRSFLSFLS